MTTIPFKKLQAIQLSMLNELVVAHKSATSEDTWPPLRDAVLARYSAEGTMDSVTWEDMTSTEDEHVQSESDSNVYTLH